MNQMGENSGPMATAKKFSIPVDDSCSLKGAEVHEDFDCILNQTNIGANNNKFYVIQLLTKGGKFYAWNRWGRVGETGQNSLVGPVDLAKAQKAFQSKFKDMPALRAAREGLKEQPP